MKCLCILIVAAILLCIEVSPVDLRSGDVVELAHVSLQVEGAAGRVSQAGDAALHVDPDSELGQGVVGQATGLAMGEVPSRSERQTPIRAGTSGT